MAFKTLAMIGATAFSLFSATAFGATEVDVNVGVGLGRPRPVVVQPPPTVVTNRTWVPDRVERRAERVLVEPGRVERREERVLVEPARVERREERVLVEPGRVDRVYVPPVVDRVRVGPVLVSKTVREGYHQEVAVPPRYEVVVREVPVPPRYRTVVREVEVPPRYDTVYREVVVEPGHYVEVNTVHEARPVIVETRPAVGVDLQFDFWKKKDRDRRR